MANCGKENLYFDKESHCLSSFNRNERNGFKLDKTVHPNSLTLSIIYLCVANYRISDVV